MTQLEWNIFCELLHYVCVLGDGIIKLKKTFQITLSEEVHDDNMQYNMSQDKVGESTLGSDAEERCLVLWIGLQSQTNWKYTGKF